jgi:hypothetical protein
VNDVRIAVKGTGEYLDVTRRGETVRFQQTVMIVYRGPVEVNRWRIVPWWPR